MACFVQWMFTDDDESVCTVGVLEAQVVHQVAGNLQVFFVQVQRGRVRLDDARIQAIVARRNVLEKRVLQQLNT